MCFLKAFENISQFEGRAKFSTWLISIAVNTGTEMLRHRKPSEPIEGVEDDDFRPRQIQRWADDPEQIFFYRSAERTCARRDLTVAGEVSGCTDFARHQSVVN
jgi:DNA-directed RNA polymerase specialized sigma24 family protein